MSEFDFEMRLCACLETNGHPQGAISGGGPIVARQIGGGVHDLGSRVIDTVLVAPAPGFAKRAAITPETIPDPAIEAAIPTGRAISRREAFADFDVSPERQRAVIERAAGIGFLERERRDGHEYVRQSAPYPDWYGDLIAVENKPDLAKPGDLDRQLRFDVALSLFDRVVLATASHVTRGHLNRIPEDVGVWRFREGSIEVVREATPLSTDAPGTEISAERAGRTGIAPVSAAAKARRRRRIAERAYGKGFRTDGFPACEHVEATRRHGAGGLPYCTFYDRLVDPGSECGPDCPGHAPAEPPAVDLAALRAENSPWTADPEGRARTQSGLDQF
ncbi:MAG: DUF5787 family protein [Halobacteriales archaeon]